MATYQYHCISCGHDFQRSESMSAHDKAHPACPKCKSVRVEQVLATFFAKTARKT
jgi:putative FmdB family regulatory protein